MALPLRDLKTEARNLARAGQFAAALAAHEQMLAVNPLDGDSRRKIGDLLFQLGDQAGAVEVFRTVAMHDVRSGHLLPALVGCKVLESLGQSFEQIVAAMAHFFAHGAPALAKFAARQAPVDLDAPIEPPQAAADLAKLVPRARARALDLSAFVQYPEQFLPVAFFSELPPELFPAAVRMVRLLRLGEAEVVFREGDPGSAFYFVAAGEVRVVAGGQPVAGRPTRSVELTRLLEGALFGEMALMTDQPRTASIQVVGEAELLEVSRAAVAELTAAVPVLAERLDRFARERLLKNLLATSPLFKPFDNQQQMELVRRFEGIDVEPGTTIIRENEIGQGLFVILLGEVEVLRHGAPVARLRAGELFGEMALLGDSPTTAAVRTVGPTSILFLGRDYFRRLVAALPVLRKYFEDLSRSRSAANV
ncbi:MAG TPA: cyclic nucleotide-binding domain-containing protein [Polyangia bacterium]|jgi:CRP-like cAMP-binding protein|nr:cyclic nucleotide-binding domain-containing protein [Polyangia bacterium]